MPSDKSYRYAPTAVPAEIGIGLLDWLRREFRLIANALQLLWEQITTLSETKTLAQYGGMGTSTSNAVTDLGAGWQDVTSFGAVTAQRGIVTDAAQGRFTIPKNGDFLLQFTGVLLHNELNAGRSFTFRVYNYTTGAAGAGILVPTGRDTIATVVIAFMTSPVSVDNAQIGFQIGGGDVYTGVSWGAKTALMQRLDPGVQV